LRTDIDMGSQVQTVQRHIVEARDRRVEKEYAATFHTRKDHAWMLKAACVEAYLYQRRVLTAARQRRCRSTATTATSLGSNGAPMTENERLIQRLRASRPASFRTPPETLVLFDVEHPRNTTVARMLLDDIQ